MRVLWPRNARWLPSAAERARARERWQAHPPERFATYADYFFFLHIDPRNRAVHVTGMLIGLGLFGWALALAALLSPWCAASFFAGHLFFIGFGVLGHWLYDGTAAARTDRAYFLRAFPWILGINLKTLFGTYDDELRAFVARYPFVGEAFELQEREVRSLWPWSSRRARARRLEG